MARQADTYSGTGQCYLSEGFYHIAGEEYFVDKGDQLQKKNLQIPEATVTCVLSRISMDK